MSRISVSAKPCADNHTLQSLSVHENNRLSKLSSYRQWHITLSSSQEADTDDQQGTLTYEEFSVFYKMMSLRRDLYLLMMAYSDRKDHLTAEELVNFLHNEQKVRQSNSQQRMLKPITVL